MNRTVGYTLLGAGALLAFIGIVSKNSHHSNNADSGNCPSGDTLTFSPMEFVAMADAVYNAKGMFDDDEEAFYRVFESLRTKGDLLQLINVFGERQYYTFGSSMNMNAWVKDTLGISEQQRVKAVYNKFNVPY